MENETDSATYLDYEYEIFQNNTNLDYFYYKFDYNNKGNSTIILKNNYEFNTLYNFNFCELKMLTNTEGKAFHLIDSNITCSEYFQNKHTFHCGYYYNNSYQLCLDINEIKFSTNKSNVYQNFDLNNTINGEIFCPLGGFYIDENLIQTRFFYIKQNKAYMKYNFVNHDDSHNEEEEEDEDDSHYYEANEINFSTFQQDFINEANISQQVKEGLLLAEIKLKEFIDNNFFFDFDQIAFSNHENYLTANSSEAKILKSDPMVYSIGEKNGFLDAFTDTFLTLNFDAFYNFTFFNKSISLNNSIYYNPSHLEYNIEKSFIRPYANVENNDDVGKVHLNRFTFQSISVNCYVNGILPGKETAFLKSLKYLNISSFTETIMTIIAWLFVKLFVSYYFNFNVRFKVIQNKYTGTLNQADKDSEFISKITPKILEAVIFILIIFILLYHDYTINKSVLYLDVAIDYDCFLSINEYLSAYKVFLIDIQNKNKLVFWLVIISAGIESFSVVSYVFLFLIDLAQIKKKEMEEEKLKFEIDQLREKKNK